MRNPKNVSAARLLSTFALWVVVTTLFGCSAAVQDFTASAPVASAPVASAPVASAPVASAPVASAPVASAPVASDPMVHALDWVATFREGAEFRGMGEYQAEGEVGWEFESMSPETLEPSGTLRFQISEASRGGEIVFEDTAQGLEHNPNFDSSEPTSGSNSPFLRVAGAISAMGWVDREFEDLMVQGTVNVKGEASSRQGLMARWDKGNNFYWFYVNFSNGQFGINRSHYYGVMSDLKAGTVEDFDRSKPYRLEFTLVGDTLLGEIFETNGGGKGKLVGSTGKIQDPEAHLRGVTGVLAELAMEEPTVPLAGSFSEVKSTALGDGSRH